MRFHTIFLLAIALGVGSSNGFFLKKVKALPGTLTAVKSNFVSDAKAAVEDLKEAGQLKAKAVTGGIKAVGNAKLGVLKGIKDAKVGVLKGIAGAKLTKVAALKAGKAAFAKTVVAAKLAPVIATGVKVGALKNVASYPLAQNLLQSIKSQSSSSSSSASNSLLSSGLFSIIGGALAGSSSTSSKPSGSLLPDFASILTRVGSGSGNVALYPAPSVLPTRINIITYKTDATNGQSSISGNHGYVSWPNIDQRSKTTSSSATNFGASITQDKDNIVSAPVINYGNSLSQRGNIPVPATNYGVPETQRKIVSPPVNSYGTPFKAISPSTSDGSPVL